MALEDKLGAALAACRDDSEKELVRDVYAFFEEQRASMTQSRQAHELRGTVMAVGYDRHEEIGTLFANSWNEAETALREGIYHPESPVILYEFRTDIRDGQPHVTGYGQILLPVEIASTYVDCSAKTKILPRPQPA